MPKLPTNTEFENSFPKVEDLAKGETLNIISINPEFEKTPKNGYEMIHLVTKEHGEMVTLATAVKNKLKEVLKAVDEGDFTFSEDDPITCTVDEYSSHGKDDCKSLV